MSRGDLILGGFISAVWFALSVISFVIFFSRPGFNGGFISAGIAWALLAFSELIRTVEAA